MSTKKKVSHGARTKRGSVLYTYVKPKNKAWVEKQAEKDGLSISHFLDMLIESAMTQ